MNHYLHGLAHGTKWGPVVSGVCVWMGTGGNNDNGGWGVVSRGCDVITQWRKRRR